MQFAKFRFSFSKCLAALLEFQLREAFSVHPRATAHYCKLHRPFCEQLSIRPWPKKPCGPIHSERLMAENIHCAISISAMLMDRKVLAISAIARAPSRRDDFSEQLLVGGF